MISRLKEYAIALGGILLAILGAMGYAYEKGRSGKEKEDAEAALKQTQKADEAMAEGQQHETEVQHEKIDTIKRTDFE